MLVGKNNLYCDLLLITNELILCVVISSIRFCTCFYIVPNSTSPILAVPAIVLKPSGAKNTTSPASSCMLPPSMQPIFLVTGATAKFAKAVPDNLNILSFPLQEVHLSLVIFQMVIELVMQYQIPTVD